MNKITIIEYPKCSTCINAKKWLVANNIDFIDRDIKLDNPAYSELQEFSKLDGFDYNKIFNKSGLVYKALNLKEKIGTMTNDEKLQILSTDGMLIKRPLIIFNNQIIIGFNEKIWSEKLVK